jgi:hypothetical protein
MPSVKIPASVTMLGREIALAELSAVNRIQTSSEVRPLVPWISTAGVGKAKQNSFHWNADLWRFIPGLTTLTYVHLAWTPAV